MNKAWASVWDKLQPLEVVLVWARRPENLAVVCVCFLVLIWMVLRLIRWSGRKPFSLQVCDPRKSHRWKTVQFVEKPTYCNSCDELSVSGSCCESCGLCTCARSKCLEVADRVQTCKPLSKNNGGGGGDGGEEKWCHHWVKGNLPLFSRCFRFGIPRTSRLLYLLSLSPPPLQVFDAVRGPASTGRLSLRVVSQDDPRGLCPGDGGRSEGQLQYGAPSVNDYPSVQRHTQP